MSRINAKTKILFEDTPIRKALFKLAWPSLFMMLTFAAYGFTDSVLSINLASGNYNTLAQKVPGMDGKDLVRLFMTAGSPITSFLNSIALLFSVGVGVRFSIHLGRHDKKQALVVMRTGFMFALGLSLILIPALLLTAKAWMATLYTTGGKGANPVQEAAAKALVVNNGFSYIWIIIASTPLILLNQLIASLLRSEGRPKEMAIAAGTPLLLNIFFDWVFMGPLKWGVAGGAAATVLSYFFTTFILIYFIFKNKKSLITFKNLFGFRKISLMTIFAIVLVGASPFLRNFAQSITTTFENRVIGAISIKFDNNSLQLRNILAGVFPVFMLAFPLVFAFTQAGSPLASYNYGAKNYKRVKETFKWTIIYSFVFGLIVYALIAAPYMLGTGLLKALGVQESNMDESLKVIRIMLSMLPLFGILIGSLTLFMSTDRIVFSLIASSLRGFILFFPMLYLFRWLSLDVFNSKDIFWWFYPCIVGLTALISSFMVLIALRHLETKHKTLDERIETWNKKINAWKSRHFKNRSVVSTSETNLDDKNPKE